MTVAAVAAVAAAGARPGRRSGPVLGRLSALRERRPDVDPQPRSAGFQEPGRRRAHELALNLGCVTLLGRIENLVRSARVKLGRTAEPPHSTWPELTAREREMLPYIMSGHTYADIAKTLFVTEKTVSVHAATMLRKTGTANRVELAQLAQRRRSNARREPSRSEHG